MSERPRRARRGDPDATRAQLVDAARAVLERDGYQGTDSNRIAAEAGYATGTFYKHFADKREILLAAYARWQGDEWAGVARDLARDEPPCAIARRVVARVVRAHARGRGVRAAVLALVPTDERVRRFYRARRRAQLDALERLGTPTGARSRARGATLLYLLERTADALANGEHRDLHVSRAALQGLLVSAVETALRETGGGVRRS